MEPFALILPAAGRSTRFGDPRAKKIFADLGGRAVFLRALDPFISRADVAQVVLAIHPEDRNMFDRIYFTMIAFSDLIVIDGGAERHDTIAAALAALDPSCRFVAIHDAARPCVSSEVIDRVFAAARESGAAVPGVAVADTLKRLDPDGRCVAETVPRGGLVAVQTPQAFRRDLLEAAYAQRGRVAGITDDAQLVEALGHPVRVVEGSPSNLKITRAEDLAVASAFLRAVADAP